MARLTGLTGLTGVTGLTSPTRLITLPVQPMRAKRSWLTGLLAASCLVLAGCGAGDNPRAFGLTDVPLPSGAQIATHVRSCDRGANPYCAEQLVVVGPHYQSSAALLAGEKQVLAERGWTTTAGADGVEKGADSPGHELRLTYATAYEDLLGIDSSWIQRRPPIAHALSTEMFDRASAISLMLVRGSS